MKESTLTKVNDFFESNPIAKQQPSTIEEIAFAEKELGIMFDRDNVFFLLTYGGSMVKSNEIYGLNNSELLDEIDIIDLT